MAKTTASASGTNRYRATPLRKNIGRKTMQMHRVETERGYRDLRRAFENGLSRSLAFLEMALDVFDRHGGVVDQDADGQRQSAQGHDVDGLAEKAEDDDGRRGSTAESRPR